ncbi:hypothetical protein Trydic_g23716 [Trypoxylus dichotomus]
MNTQLLRDFGENLDTEGFDAQAGQTWIYPINYPLRNYQFNIVSESLFKNTLVSLPTGLGKTFIAAVVMYNFYRWYPSGKVVFMAPTKPLVKQQLQACYNIMAIPKEVTAELTGTKAQTSRKDVWMNKRVFFITPQVLQNDLNLIPELGKQIKCVVIDEAHKAKGNHAYCEVLRKIVENNKQFRVLALSATPGSTIMDVSEVINNLLISHLEIRTDDSPDVMPYVFQRTMETIVVPLGEKLQSVKAAYLQLLEKYTRVLMANRIIVGNNCANLTKGRIFMIMKEFQEKNRHTKMKGYGDIMRNLNICVTLYHGYELLTRHGLRGFLNFFEEHSDQALLRGNILLDNIKADVQEYLGPAPSIDMLPDGKPPEISPLTKFGHPKFYKLQEILLNHFSDKKNISSKVIVFTEYKESVKEIYALLIQHNPVIKPKYFLGQSSITQKQQILAINSFRSGDTNTLVSTCIGEEGLDIGEVDLIICFDISNKSPIRMVQRMGRTGRKKEGKIIVLVTEGKEEEILKECLVNKHYLSKNILKSKGIHSNLFQHNPRMVPDSITPTCKKIHISVPKNTKTVRKRSLKDMLNNMAGGSKESPIPEQFTDIEIIETKDRIPDTFMIWDKGKINCMETNDSFNEGKISFSKRLDTLRVAQPIGIIGHSKNCDILSSLMQFADSKRYNIPVIQTRVSEISPVKNKKSKFARHNSSDNYKQTDIRTMFFKSQTVSTQATARNDAENIMELINKDKANDLINELHAEISAYMSLSCAEESNCKICDKLFICYRTTKRNTDINLETWIPPDIRILDDLNLNNILKFERSLNPMEQMLDNTELALFADIDDRAWDECHDKTHNFTFEPPKSANKVVQMSNIEKSAQTPKNMKDSSDADILSFFNLDGVQSIFTDDVTKSKKSPIPRNKSETDSSPVLNTFERKPRIRVSKNLFPADVMDSGLNGAAAIKAHEDPVRKPKPRLSNLSNVKKSNFFKPKNIEQDEKDQMKEVITSDSHVNQLLSNIQDFCDLSLFGIEMSQKRINSECKDTSEESNTVVNLKETSNSGSEDLFGSCSNSPVKNNFNGFRTSQHLEAEIDTSEKDQILVENDYFEESSSPVLAKDILKTKSQRYAAERKVIKHDKPNLESKQEFLAESSDFSKNVPKKLSKQETEKLSAFDICDISIFGLPNADSISNDDKKIKEEMIKDSPNKNASHVYDFCDLSIFGIQSTNLDAANMSKAIEPSIKEPFMDATNKSTPRSQRFQNKEPSQISITQILEIVNKYRSPQEEKQTTSNHCQEETISPLIIALSDDDSFEIPKYLKTPKTQTTHQQSSVKKILHPKRKRISSPIVCDSEDEFEESPFKKSNGWINVKKSVRKDAPPKIVEKSSGLTKVKKPKKKKIPKTYIDDEAVLTSSDEAVFKDSQSEASTGEDIFDASFVNDETFANTTAMHAKYLQSTKSPLLNKGAFKIPTPPAVKQETLFSQEVDNKDDTYMNDTFCVDDDFDLTQNDDLSELELAEKLLEERRKRKVKKDFKNRKKTEVITLSSDSD